MAQDATLRSTARFTTIVGGCALAASALLVLIVVLPSVTLNGAAGLSWYMVPPAAATVIEILAALLLAAAVYGLAFGIRGEAGLVGNSRAGKVAALVFVAATVVKNLIRLIMLVWPPQITADSLSVQDYIRSDLQLGLGVVALACVIVAVIVAVRRRALNRPLRWGLVIVTAWHAIFHAFQYFPFVPTQPNATFMTFVIFVLFDGVVVGLLLQFVVGVGIALHGQSAALRRRAAIINEHW